MGDRRAAAMLGERLTCTGASGVVTSPPTLRANKGCCRPSRKSLRSNTSCAGSRFVPGGEGGHRNQLLSSHDRWRRGVAEVRRTRRLRDHMMGERDVLLLCECPDYASVAKTGPT